MTNKTNDQLIEELHNKWSDCTKCALCREGRRQIVFKDGSATAPIMIVGEGPGAVEDSCGVPFSGPAGKLFTEVLAKIGINRQDCYWTNTVRCKPLGENGRQVKAPTSQEVRACNPLLQEEIKIIQPKVIIITGSTAAKALINLKGSISAVVGRWTNVGDIKAMVIYHPAAVLHTKDRDSALCSMYKKSIWNSLKEVKAFMDSENKPAGVVVTKELSHEREMSWSD